MLTGILIGMVIWLLSGIAIGIGIGKAIKNNNLDYERDNPYSDYHKDP